ncbi:acyl-[acyl-carrier-protein] thioesterase [Ornithinibacillus bavariensis]|uniref:Acyl-ACP thioesterase n=1 Tax=Ornithinibacillus bavariensis TaxID=545502 RepID=A0A920C5A3_9BACI|nr:acyl-ACP thioesterase domain-containing protein [Ornithinibacillus bavariensis]GIO26515.1 acyl-ACP thioesterase [Ornithinibacillus bavariensis]
MEPVTRFQKDYHIDLRDVDFKKELKLSTLFGFFQDVANLASDNLGVGFEALDKNYGVAFVLMRIRVEVIRIPKLDEEIEIETWPLEPGKLEFERDFIVKDKDGNIIVRATSVWVLMDLRKRRLKRSDSIDLVYPEIITERAIEGSLDKLRAGENLETTYHKTIGYSDIDFNGHLNNSRYVDYIMDCFSVEQHRNYRIHTIEVNYLNEALPGDTIILKKDLSNLNDNTVIVEGIRSENEKMVFRSQVKIIKKQG